MQTQMKDEQSYTDFITGAKAYRDNEIKHIEK